MHAFDYRDGILHAEDVPLTEIAAGAGTPTYVYASSTIERHYRVFAEAVGAPQAKVFYAVKANGNLGVLMTLAALGAGADVVSEGEILKSLAAGIPPERIVFSGVGKSAAELARAVETRIHQVNVESEGELELLSQVAAQRGTPQAIVFRVNPDVGAGGHAKITTGSAANKFGIAFTDVERLYHRAAGLPGIAVKGLAVHIGSQITDFAAMEEAFARLVALVRKLRAGGASVERLDLGGGIGIPYAMQHPYVHGPDVLEDYGRMVRRVTAGLEVELGFEPGRVIVGNAGILLSRVLYLNTRSDRRFLVLDAAMNDLVRPAMYEAYHEIWPVKQPAPDAPLHPHDVVGPVCESGDTFATDRPLPPLAQGDLIAFMTAGAYGAAMASTYNQRPLVAEVLVRGDAFSITRKRQTLAQLVGSDSAPRWFSETITPSARLREA